MLSHGHGRFEPKGFTYTPDSVIESADSSAAKQRETPRADVQSSISPPQARRLSVPKRAASETSGR